MITNRVDFSSYGEMLAALKDEGFLSPQEWAAMRSKLGWDLERRCHEICDELKRLHDATWWVTPILEDMDPTDLNISFRDIKEDMCKQFSRMYSHFEELDRVREYLRELKQLD